MVMDELTGVKRTKVPVFSYNFETPLCLLIIRVASSTYVLVVFREPFYSNNPYLLSLRPNSLTT